MLYLSPFLWQKKPKIVNLEVFLLDLTIEHCHRKLL